MENYISTLGKDDFESWRPLWDSYLEFYSSDMSSADSKVTFSRLTSATEPMGGFLARDAHGVACGIAHWLTHPSTWGVKDYCYLQDLYVDAERRTGGIGSRLIEAVYATALKRNCSRVYWLTHRDNASAIRLYDKVASGTGFIQYRKMLNG